MRELLLVALVALVLLVTGCKLHIAQDQDSYTKAETDAITARMQCRQTARSMIEILRCGVD